MLGTRLPASTPHTVTQTPSPAMGLPNTIRIQTIPTVAMVPTMVVALMEATRPKASVVGDCVVCDDWRPRLYIKIRKVSVSWLCRGWIDCFRACSIVILGISFVSYGLVCLG